MRLRGLHIGVEDLELGVQFKGQGRGFRGRDRSMGVDVGSLSLVLRD